MRVHYVLKCSGCGAPAADCVRICPYCGQSTDFPGLGTASVQELDDGTMHIGEGAHVEVGGLRDRECPFCGAMNEATVKHCGHCGAKVVIEKLRISRLVIEGGKMTIGGGAKLEIVGRRKQPIHDAAAAGDLERVKERVMSGSDPDLQDEKGRRAIHYAAPGGHLEVCQWLVSVGADPASRDESGVTARILAETAGQAGLVDFFSMVGG